MESPLPSGIRQGGSGVPSNRCGLCAELFDDPVVGTCGHLFCWQCVLNAASYRNFGVVYARAPPPGERLAASEAYLREHEDRTADLSPPEAPSSADPRTLFPRPATCPRCESALWPHEFRRIFLPATLTRAAESSPVPLPPPPAPDREEPGEREDGPTLLQQLNPLYHMQQAADAAADDPNLTPAAGEVLNDTRSSINTVALAFGAAVFLCIMPGVPWWAAILALLASLAAATMQRPGRGGLADR